MDPLKSCHKDIVRKEFTPPEGGYLLALFYFLWTLLQTDMKRRSFFSEIGNMRLLRNCVYHSVLSNRGTVYILISSSESPPDMCCPFSSRFVETALLVEVPVYCPMELSIQFYQPFLPRSSPTIYSALLNWWLFIFSGVPLLEVCLSLRPVSAGERTSPTAGYFVKKNSSCLNIFVCIVYGLPSKLSSFHHSWCV